MTPSFQRLSGLGKSGSAILLVWAASGFANGAAAADKIGFGDPAEQAYLTRSYLFVESAVIEGYLRSVLQKLIAASGKPRGLPDVLIYSSDEFSASTDANDNLLITTEALRKLESEDELAALLGHELSHILLRHNQRKSALRAFPMGVETAGWVAVAGDRVQGDGTTRASSASMSDFGKYAVVNTQAASLLWSDVLTPAWNRAQERAADRSGFDLMRAAGYDPAAFGTLFSKLSAAQAHRSERMEVLREVAEQRVAESGRSAPDGGVVEEVATKVKTTVRTISVDAVFDGLTNFNRDYDPPDLRQQQLAKHAEESGRRADKRPRSPRFAQMLREGIGGRLLGADGAAIQTMRALNSGQIGKAGSAVARILPAAGSEPLSPHLNLAIGAWYARSGKTALAEQRVSAWLKARSPPAHAYLWRAYLQWARKDYDQTLITLEGGISRVGNAAPFLPYLVSAAVANGQKKRAEGYVARCAQEDRKGPNAVVAFITFRGQAAPTGLYQECVVRLGYEPERESLMRRAVRAPLKAGETVAEKVRGVFRRKRTPEP